MLGILNLLFYLLAPFSQLVSESPHRVPLINLNKHNGLSTHMTMVSGNVNFGLSPYAIPATLGKNVNIKTAIQLYTSNSFLASCAHFINPNCSAPVCNITDTPSNLVFPQFDVNGTTVETSVSFGDFNTGSIYITYATECDDNPFPDGIYSGSVGLGVENNQNGFFGSQTAFSIYVNEESSDGELIFGVDWFKKSIDYLALLTGISLNWEIPTATFFFGNQNTTISGYTIVDLNMGYIVVPYSGYQMIIDVLKTNGLNCRRDYDGVISVSAVCVFSGSLPSLPNFYIQTNNGSIEIMQSIYLGDPDGNTVNLMIVPSSTNIDFTVQVNEQYENYTILGMPFLNYYYVEFDFTNYPNNQIFLYKAYDGLFDSPTNFALGVGGGVLLLVLLCCGCCYFSKRRADKAKKEQARAFLRHKQNFEMDESKFI